MYTWLLPAVKAVLPHVGTIISAALPVFQSRKIDENAATQEALLQKQITELQDVASQNAVHIKELAEQLKQMVVTLEQGVIANERRYRRLTLLSGIASLLSIAAIGLWLFGSR
ncbi:hypothetical protein D3C87_53720 [compost metagenome]|jgi:uncharacterized protein YlxW (UPF0749 family)